MIREPFNWQRLSGIAAVLPSPDGRRLRWLLAIHPGSIRASHLVQFLRALSRHRRKPVILLWDRLPAHRSRLVQQAVQTCRAWLHTEWLPAYAPELNPVEPFWDHLDDTVLANTPADDLRRLRQRVHQGLRHVRRHPAIARGFLRYTGLF